jgi:hypothetical protein
LRETTDAEPSRETTDAEPLRETTDAEPLRETTDGLFGEAYRIMFIRTLFYIRYD